MRATKIRAKSVAWFSTLVLLAALTSGCDSSISLKPTSVSAGEAESPVLTAGNATGETETASLQNDADNANAGASVVAENSDSGTGSVAETVEQAPAAALPDSTPEPELAWCSSELVDDTGDGWGWENGETCQFAQSVQSDSTNSTNTTAEIESAPVNSAEAKIITAADITDLILVTGQSNALGVGTEYDATLDAPHNRVFAFTDSGWQKADLHQVWDYGWHPRGDPNEDPSNNFALHFGKRLAELSPDRVIGFVLVTAPGQPIGVWHEGDFYQQLRARVLQAINWLPTNKGGLDGILWHQGESNAEDTDYRQKLQRVISDFRAENWFDDGRPFICGETAQELVVNQYLRELNGDADPWTACINAVGLPTQPDGAHFNAEGLRAMGQRYADAYLNMRRQR